VTYNASSEPVLYWNDAFLLVDKRGKPLPVSKTSENTLLFSLEDMDSGGSSCLNIDTSMKFCTLLLLFPLNEGSGLHGTAYYIFHLKTRKLHPSIARTELLPSTSNIPSQNHTTTSEMLARIAHPFRGASIKLADHCDFGKASTEVSYRDLHLQVLKAPATYLTLNYTLWRCTNSTELFTNDMLIYPTLEPYCYYLRRPTARIQDPNACEVTFLFTTPDAGWGYVVHQRASQNLILYDAEDMPPKQTSSLSNLILPIFLVCMAISVFVCSNACTKPRKPSDILTPDTEETQA
jgi:hypothetical protein